jgi:hypothetical protein
VRFGRGGALALGDTREQVDHSLIVLQRLRGEPRDGAADVVAGIEAGRRGDGAGEEALAERAIWHEADAEVLAGSQQLFLRPPPPQGVLALQRPSRVGLHALDG